MYGLRNGVVAVRFLFRIWEVTGSNPGPETDSPKFFVVFLSPIEKKWLILRLYNDYVSTANVV